MITVAPLMLPPAHCSHHPAWATAPPLPAPRAAQAAAALALQVCERTAATPAFHVNSSVAYITKCMLKTVSASHDKATHLQSLPLQSFGRDVVRCLRQQCHKLRGLPWQMGTQQRDQHANSAQSLQLLTHQIRPAGSMAVSTSVCMVYATSRDEFNEIVTSDARSGSRRSALLHLL